MPGKGTSASFPSKLLCIGRNRPSTWGRFMALFCGIKPKMACDLITPNLHLLPTFTFVMVSSERGRKHLKRMVEGFVKWIL